MLNSAGLCMANLGNGLWHGREMAEQGLLRAKPETVAAVATGAEPEQLPSLADMLDKIVQVQDFV